jgi:hypothetical protein
MPVCACPYSSKFEQNNQPNYSGKQLLQLAIFRMQTFKDAATHVGLGVHLLSSNTAAWTTRWLS